MNSTHLLFAPVLVVAGLAATPSHAHGVASATVALPPVVVDVGDVHVAIGQPPPPVILVSEPPPVVYREPEYREVVVYRDAYPAPRNVVIVHPRERERVVYVDNDCDHAHHPQGNAYGYWKKHGGDGHGKGHGKHHGDADRGARQAKHRR